MPLCGWKATGTASRTALVTLHRPSNVDDPEGLGKIMKALGEVARGRPVVFPVHPRTRQRLGSLALDAPGAGLRLIEPLGYVDFLALQRHAAVVITDSGGVQEETTFLGVPCLTLRENTERPITVKMGTNRLLGQHPERLAAETTRALANGRNGRQVPPLWDGKASERIAAVVAAVLEEILV